MIDAIVFDVGRVLFHYDPQKLLDTLIPDSPHHETYLEHLFYADIWQQMDRGDVCRDTAVARLAPLVDHCPDHSADIGRLIDEFADHLEVIEGTKHIFESLAERYPLYILSNFQDAPFDRLLRANPFMNLAKGKVVSAKVNMMKPEPSIYRYLLDTYGLEAAKTLFIDDLAENIAACRDVGMQGIVFKSPEQLIADLMGYKITAQPSF